MNRYVVWLIRYRIPVLIGILIVTVGLGSLLPTLRADDDVMQFLPADDPDVELFQRVNERFGGLDVAIVGLLSDDLFTFDHLTELRMLTRKLRDVDGVFDVLSFTEVPDPRPSPFGLVVEPLVDRVPRDRAALTALKQKVLANENAVGNLVSTDGRAAMVLCFLGGSKPPMHVATDIKTVARANWTDGSLYYGGAPFIRLHVAGGTKRDVLRLTPIVAVVIILVTFILFRKPLSVVLAVGAILISMVWLMGLLALRGKGVTIVGSSLPTLMVAIGGAYGIHLLAAYFNGHAATNRERIAEAFDEVAAPIGASAMTTCAGFLSFLVMDVVPLREFGAYAALGVALTAGLVLTVIPTVLSFAKRAPKTLNAARIARPLGRLSGWAEIHRRRVIFTAIVLATAGLVGILRIAPDATLKSFYAEGSEPDQANQFLTRHFGGSVFLQVYFEGDMRSPFVLAELREIVEFAQGLPEVVAASSIIDPITMMSEALGGRAGLPISRARTRSLYPFLEGSAAINQLVAEDKNAGLIQLRLRDLDPAQTQQVIDRLGSFIRDNIPAGVVPIDLTSAQPEERIRISRQIARTVAERIGRLLKMYRDIAPTEDQLVRHQALILEELDRPLRPGDNLRAPVAAIVDEHIVGENSPLEAPPEDGSPVVGEEWRERGERPLAALVATINAPHTPERITAALEQALPLTAERDRPGLELAAQAVSNGLTMAVPLIRANRLTPLLLAELSTVLSEKEQSAIVWALTDVFQTTVPTDSAQGSPIIAQISGQPVINTAFCQSTIRNQLKSLATAWIVLTLILSGTFGTIRNALTAQLPTAVTLCLAVGIMGVLDIPLDLTTSMIAAIALGIGVDYSVHYLWRRTRRNETMAQTIEHAGPPIASSAIQVASGFMVMTLSATVPTQRFGALVATTMILCALATFVLLPAIRVKGQQLD